MSESKFNFKVNDKVIHRNAHVTKISRIGSDACTYPITCMHDNASITTHTLQGKAFITGEDSEWDIVGIYPDEGQHSATLKSLFDPDEEYDKLSKELIRNMVYGDEDKMEIDDISSKNLLIALKEVNEEDDKEQIAYAKTELRYLRAKKKELDAKLEEVLDDLETVEYGLARYDDSVLPGQPIKIKLKRKKSGSQNSV
jgi:ABC-type oligopeptide transport system ATPase subunit